MVIRGYVKIQVPVESDSSNSFKVKCVVLSMFIGLAVMYARGQDDVFPLKTDPVNGWEVISTRTYDGSGLWGYIDGGADLYLEYGFDRVYLQELMVNEHRFKIETFCMSDRLAAFGIFSVNRFRCLFNDTLTMFHCISTYQILAALDRYYLIISDQEGTPIATQIGISMLKVISGMIPNEAFQVPEPFTGQDAKDQLKYMRGKLGLMNGFPSLSDLLDTYEDFTLFAMSIEGKQKKHVLARIGFADMENQADFINRLTVLSDNDPEMIVYKKIAGPNDIVFMIGNRKEMRSMRTYRSYFRGK